MTSNSIAQIGENLSPHENTVSKAEIDTQHLIKHIEGLPTYKKYGDIRGKDEYINKNDILDYIKGQQ